MRVLPVTTIVRPDGTKERYEGDAQDDKHGVSAQELPPDVTVGPDDVIWWGWELVDPPSDPLTYRHRGNTSPPSG